MSVSAQGQSGNPQPGNSTGGLLSQTVKQRDAAAPVYQSRFLRAARGEPTDTVPVWIMRQAGRYLPEYMSVRKHVTFIELCKRPDLAAEVTLTAQSRLNADAAILFADLLPILEPMGLDLEYAKGEGPVIHNPVRTAEEVDRVRPLTDVSSLSFVFETVRRVRADLPTTIPLLGFAGAPFTLASYIIEGGSSKNYTATKTIMRSDGGAWHQLMTTLVDTLVIYLTEQLVAGCQAVQLFDSWAGCLSPADYRRYVLPYSKAIIDRVSAQAPVIHFLTGNPALLPLCAEAGGQVIGLDWRVELDAAWETVGRDRAVQGHLDPVLLFNDWPIIEAEVRKLLSSTHGRPGHIFNLGHGVLPETDYTKVLSLVKLVHDLGARAS